MGEQQAREYSILFLSQKLDLDRELCSHMHRWCSGRKSGLAAQIKAVNPNITTACWMSHRQKPKFKSMDPDLHSVQNTLIMTLQQQEHYSYACLAAFVRGCEQGRALISFWRLLTFSKKGIAAIFTFLRLDKPNMAALFSNLFWLAKLACLDDIFNLLNNVKLSV